MCRKYNIECQFLIIVGYPTETEEDFYETLKLMSQLRPRFKGDRSVNWSLSSFGFEYDSDETPLNKNPSLHQIKHDTARGWYSPIVDNYVALKRTRALYKFLEDLGYPIYQEWEHENETDLEFVENNLHFSKRENEIIEDISISSALLAQS